MSFLKKRLSKVQGVPRKFMNCRKSAAARKRLGNTGLEDVKKRLTAPYQKEKIQLAYLKMALKL